jgi:hypothetical protein
LIVAVQLFSLAVHAQAVESNRANFVLAGLLWTFLPILLLGVLLFWFMRSKWETWAPFQSRDVREICTHMTKAEKREGQRRGALYGLWVAATFAIPLSQAMFFPNPALVTIAAILIIIHIACVPLWLGRQRKYFCSTAWAKEQGFSPERLRLFSFLA